MAENGAGAVEAGQLIGDQAPVVADSAKEAAETPVVEPKEVKPVAEENKNSENMKEKPVNSSSEPPSTENGEPIKEAEQEKEAVIANEVEKPKQQSPPLAECQKTDSNIVNNEPVNQETKPAETLTTKPTIGEPSDGAAEDTQPKAELQNTEAEAKIETDEVPQANNSEPQNIAEVEPEVSNSEEKAAEKTSMEDSSDSVPETGTADKQSEQKSDVKVHTAEKPEEEAETADKCEEEVKKSEKQNEEVQSAGQAEEMDTAEKLKEEVQTAEKSKEEVQTAETSKEEVQTAETSKEETQAIEKSEEAEQPAEEEANNSPAIVKRKRGRPAQSPKARTAPRRSAATPKKAEPREEEDAEKEEAMDTGETTATDQKRKLGSVEGPVEIQTGKRNRRKVDRLSENLTPTSVKPEKKFAVPEGAGVRLGDCPAIEEIINRTKADELKIFHKLLYGVPGKTSTEVKKNVRNFRGWTFIADDAEHKKKMAAITKINIPVLKSWCAMLKLPVGGSKDSLIDRMMTFLMSPTSVGRELQAKDRKVQAGKRKRQSDAKNSKAESQQDEEESEERESGSEQEVEEEEEEEEDKPPVKRRKATDGSSKTPARKARTPAKGKSKTPAGKGRGRGRKSATEETKEDSEEEDVPSDETIKKRIQKILKTADLELVTMKTVRQQVIDMYPEHDLSDKKDFIKATVKEILGA